jgi:hypothetical protein
MLRGKNDIGVGVESRDALRGEDSEEGVGQEDLQRRGCRLELQTTMVAEEKV